MLQRQPGYRLNERVLADYLKGLAVGGTLADVRASLDALERMALLKSEWWDELMIVALTERGEEVALGTVIVDGVLRPGPECPY